MNLQQSELIHSFYSQFLVEIYTVSSRGIYRDESEIKNEIRKWLLAHKRNKTFGEACRHEIIFIEKEVDKSSIKELRGKIANLEKNCRIIKMELESLMLAISETE